MSMMSILCEVRDPRDPNAQQYWRRCCLLCWRQHCVGRRVSCRSPSSAKRLADLREIVPLEHGMASHDTFSRVFRLLDPRVGAGFHSVHDGNARRAWPATAEGSCGDRRRSSSPRIREGEGAYAAAHGERVGQESRLTIADARAPGGSEVKATLALLKGLSLKGCTVTADALQVIRRWPGRCSPPKREMPGSSRATMGRSMRPPARLRRCWRSRLLRAREQAHGRSEWRRASGLKIDRFPNAPLSQASRRSAGSRRSELPATASQRQPSATSLCRRCSRHEAWRKSAAPIGPSRTSSIGPSTWSSTKTVLAPQGQRTREIAVVRRLAHNICEQYEVEPRRRQARPPTYCRTSGTTIEVTVPERLPVAAE